MRFLHQFGTSVYFLVVRIASIWNPKAKLFIKGRQDVWEQLKSFKPDSNPVFWFHCASLGEFEQARPLIENLKNTQNCKIVITFFSPSGYEIRKNYEHADLIVYLPKDTKTNAKRFINQIKPSKIFFIKYEFWPQFLLEAQHQNIPTYLVSAVFRKHHVFFKWYGGFMRKVLKSFNAIYVQNEASKSLLKTINVTAKFTGDTRFDRVMENAQHVKQFPLINQFVNQHKTLVIGSCWAEDETVIFPVLNHIKELKIIIAPHELSERHFTSIESNLNKKVLRYSKIGFSDNLADFDVLLIDNIGMLMHLYQYAHVAYVGGAFGKGLHNILEPASFGVPVIFGDNYAKFPEAFQFIDKEIGFSISNSNDFESKLKTLLTEDIKPKVLDFMHSQKGATGKIISDIF